MRRPGSPAGFDPEFHAKAWQPMHRKGLAADAFTKGLAAYMGPTGYGFPCYLWVQPAVAPCDLPRFWPMAGGQCSRAGERTRANTGFPFLAKAWQPMLREGLAAPPGFTPSFAKAWQPMLREGLAAPPGFTPSFAKAWQPMLHKGLAADVLQRPGSRCIWKAWQPCRVDPVVTCKGLAADAPQRPGSRCFSHFAAETYLGPA